METIDLRRSPLQEDELQLEGREEPIAGVDASHPIPVSESNDPRCGIWFFRPQCLQRFRTPKWVLFWLCWASAIQGNELSCIKYRFTAYRAFLGIYSQNMINGDRQSFFKVPLVTAVNAQKTLENALHYMNFSRILTACIKAKHQNIVDIALNLLNIDKIMLFTFLVSN